MLVMYQCSDSVLFRVNLLYFLICCYINISLFCINKRSITQSQHKEHRHAFRIKLNLNGKRMQKSVRVLFCVRASLF